MKTAMNTNRRVHKLNDDYKIILSEQKNVTTNTDTIQADYCTNEKKLSE